MENNSYSVCLTGHRPKSLPWGYNENDKRCINFKDKLTTILAEVINFGATTFYTGMAEGFDMIATEILIELKKKYPQLQIIAIIPCNGQEKFWSESQKKRYHNIIKRCDTKIVLSEKYTSTCMNDRNKYMIEKSDIVVACYNGKPSGTGNTIKMARQKGCKVIIINPCTKDL